MLPEQQRVVRVAAVVVLPQPGAVVQRPQEAVQRPQEAAVGQRPVSPLPEAEEARQDLPCPRMQGSTA